MCADISLCYQNLAEITDKNTKRVHNVFYQT